MEKEVMLLYFELFGNYKNLNNAIYFYTYLDIETTTNFDDKFKLN